jgi:hypothetical protein
MPQMNLQQLTDHVWNRLTLQKHAASRQTTRGPHHAACHRQWPWLFWPSAMTLRHEVVGTCTHAPSRGRPGRITEWASSCRSCSVLSCKRS